MQREIGTNGMATKRRNVARWWSAALLAVGTLAGASTLPAAAAAGPEVATPVPGRQCSATAGETAYGPTNKYITATKCTITTAGPGTLYILGNTTAGLAAGATGTRSIDFYLFVDQVQQ